jgi:hypothetical protein
MPLLSPFAKGGGVALQQLHSSRYQLTLKTLQEIFHVSSSSALLRT